MNDGNSEIISREQALNMKDHVMHECRVVLYAPVTDKLFGKYDMSYTVMVCNCVYCIVRVYVCVYCVCMCVVCVCIV